MPTGTLTKKIHGHENDCGEHAAEDQSDRRAADRDRRPDAERTRSLVPSAKVVEMIESAAGEISAAPSPCNAREPISIPSLTGEPVERATHGEDHESDQEEPLAAEQVAGAPAEQQEPAEDERVGADDPLQVRLAQLQVLLDRGQRHVHDRRVEHDHELRDADQNEDHPRVRAVLAGSCHCSLHLSRIVGAHAGEKTISPNDPRAFHTRPVSSVAVCQSGAGSRGAAIGERLEARAERWSGLQALRLRRSPVFVSLFVPARYRGMWQAAASMRIGIVVFDRVDLLDVGGPYEVMLTASRLERRDGAPEPFEVMTLGLTTAAVVAYGGLDLVPQLALNDAIGLDLLVIPGAVEIDRVLSDSALIEALGAVAAGVPIVASVCTGAFILQALGVLAGHDWTTHWEDIDALGRQAQRPGTSACAGSIAARSSPPGA